jgi:hypothetical protein
MRETDLYPAVKRFLEAQGYAVKGEVNNCDIVAVRNDEEPVVVELKRTLNLGVILQAIDRTTLSSKVYLAVPRRCPVLRAHKKQVMRLLRMLGLGLLTVNPGSRRGGTEVHLDPGPYKPRKSRQRKERMLREFALREGDPNKGGADRRRGIMTAYRQRALRIGLHLQEKGPMKAADVARSLGEPETRNIAYRNVYGWFERVSRGVYRLSPRGLREIPQWTTGTATAKGKGTGSTRTAT